MGLMGREIHFLFVNRVQWAEVFLVKGRLVCSFSVTAQDLVSMTSQRRSVDILEDFSHTNTAHRAKETSHNVAQKCCKIIIASLQSAVNVLKVTF